MQGGVGHDAVFIPSLPTELGQGSWMMNSFNQFLKASKRILVAAGVSTIRNLPLPAGLGSQVNLDEPFKLASGNYSPIYINCRLAVSHPTLLGLCVAFARAICEHNAVHVDVVAGGETAGIPFAAYVAQNRSLPWSMFERRRRAMVSFLLLNVICRKTAKSCLLRIL